MAEALLKVISCISGAKTDYDLEKCMSNFYSNVFQSFSKQEQEQLQEIFIDTAESIDLVAYKTTTFYIILAASLLISFILILLFYCCCICGNCCGMRTRKRTVPAPAQVNNAYLLNPNS